MTDSSEARFRIEASSNHPACEGMNLHLCVAEYSPNGQQLTVEFSDMEPMVCNKPLSLETTQNVASIGVTIYVVPTATPEVPTTTNLPDFELNVSIFKNGKLLEKQTLDVNRWGGTQRIGMRYQ